MSAKRLLAPRTVFCLLAGLAVLAILGFDRSPPHDVPSPSTGFCQPDLGSGPANDLPPELAIVPHDALVFLHVRPADMSKSQLITQLGWQLVREAADLPASPAKSLFMNFANVESISVVSPTPSAWQAFVRGRPSHFEDGAFAPLNLSGFDSSEKDFIEVQEAKAADVKKEPEKKPGDKKAKEDVDEKLPAIPANLVIVTLATPCDRPKISAAILGEPAAKTHKGKTYFMSKKKGDRRAVWFVNERTYLVASQAGDMPRILDRPPQPRPQGQLAEALELARKKHHLVAGLNMTELTAMKAKRDIERNLHRNSSYEAMAALFPVTQVMWAQASADFDKDCRLHISAAFPDAERAADAENPVKDALALIRLFVVGGLGQQLANNAADKIDSADLHHVQAPLFWSLCLKQAETALRRAKVEVKQASLNVELQGQLDVAAMLAQSRTAAADLRKDLDIPLARVRRLRKQSSKNVQQIMYGVHSFHDVYRTLPPAAICSKKDGKPLLSWRVAILPYLGHHSLYTEFKLDEPWDSAHNIKLLPRMPKTYQLEGQKTKDPGLTFYQAFTGADAAFLTIADKGNQFGARGTRMNEITDGTSNTFGVVEAFEPVPWTKPADLVYDAKKAPPRVGGLFEDGFHVGMMDASVHFLTKRIDEKTMHNFINPRDGLEIENVEKFRLE